MIGKVITVIVLLLVAIFGFSYAYQSLLADPVELQREETSTEPLEILDYGMTPVFLENLRFNHDNISFNIDASCPSTRKVRMRDAFDIFQNEMEIITFKETNSPEADILVSCSDAEVELGEYLFAAGEGGPSKIINTSQFKIIQKGKILLFREGRCDYPIVEIHELSHVFGFDHSPNEASILYNTSACDQRITPDMVKIIKELYSIEPLPDARIYDLIAVKRGKRLDFNITVLNEGLKEIENMSLTIMSGEKEIEKIYLDGIGVGYGRTLKATNVILPSRNLQTIDFILDLENDVKEFNEVNNFAQMTLYTPKD